MHEVIPDHEIKRAFCEGEPGSSSDTKASFPVLCGPNLLQINVDPYDSPPCLGQRVSKQPSPTSDIQNIRILPGLLEHLAQDRSENESPRPVVKKFLGSVFPPMSGQGLSHGLGRILARSINTSQVHRRTSHILAPPRTSIINAE